MLLRRPDLQRREGLLGRARGGLHPGPHEHLRRHAAGAGDGRRGRRHHGARADQLGPDPQGHQGPGERDGEDPGAAGPRGDRGPHPRAPPDAGAQAHPVHDGAPVHAADGRHGEDGIDGRAPERAPSSRGHRGPERDLGCLAVRVHRRRHRGARQQPVRLPGLGGAPRRRRRQAGAAVHRGDAGGVRDRALPHPAGRDVGAPLLPRERLRRLPHGPGVRPGEDTPGEQHGPGVRGRRQHLRLPGHLQGRLRRRLRRAGRGVRRREHDGLRRLQRAVPGRAGLQLLPVPGLHDEVLREAVRRSHQRHRRQGLLRLDALQPERALRPHVPDRLADRHAAAGRQGLRLLQVEWGDLPGRALSLPAVQHAGRPQAIQVPADGHGHQGGPQRLLHGGRGLRQGLPLQQLPLRRVGPPEGQRRLPLGRGVLHGVPAGHQLRRVEVPHSGALPRRERVPRGPDVDRVHVQV
mmetsp:Transcript_100983/g.218063  ORF Transcript_100983/g.218063 Transcript_100983/m.218063 type:complete len:464 (+) Transcript_100983:1111-2502(+)